MKVRKILVTLSILGIAVALAGCGKTELEKIRGNIEKDNYILAIKEFEELKDEEEKNKIEEEFKNRAIEIKNRYINEEIEEVQAVEWLNELRLVNNINEFIDEINREVNRIYDSRYALKEAKKAENEKDYKTALEWYRRVKKDDTKNFEAVQVKIKELDK